MKKLIFFILAVFALSSFAFAVEEPDFSSMVYVDGIGYMSYEEYLAYMPADTEFVSPEPEPVEDVSPEPSVDVDELTSAALLAAAEALSADDSDEMVLTDINVLSAVAPVTSADANGLKAVVLSLFGDYDPVVVEYRYTSGNGSYQNVLAEAQPDYPWIAGALIFLVIVYCLFKAGGAALCRR